MNKVKLTIEEITYEKIVSTNRVAKVVKGGRNFSFNAIVVVGNQNGVVGVGSGKANEITDAISKARNKAIANTFRVPIVRGTVPHEIKAKYGPSKILVRPASEGTGLIAGGTPRALFEAAGYKNVLAKSMGSNTPCNLVKATVVALTELRTLSQVAKLRGKKFDELSGNYIPVENETLITNIQTDQITNTPTECSVPIEPPEVDNHVIVEPSIQHSTTDEE